MGFLYIAKSLTTLYGEGPKFIKGEYFISTLAYLSKARNNVKPLSNFINSKDTVLVLDDLIHSDGPTIINILKSSTQVIGMTATPKGVIRFLQTYNRSNHKLIHLDLTYSLPFKRLTKVKQAFFKSKESISQEFLNLPQKKSLHKRDLSEELPKLTDQFVSKDKTATIIMHNDVHILNKVCSKVICSDQNDRVLQQMKGRIRNAHTSTVHIRF